MLLRWGIIAFGAAVAFMQIIYWRRELLVAAVIVGLIFAVRWVTRRSSR